MKKKLIAVDDDPVILELILNSFSSEKYEIITTSSAEEAISTYLEQPTSVILTDLKMPGMTGEMFVKRIFELGHHPIFIILTSVTDARIVVELFKIGVYDYILKPFIPGELENKVDRAFQYSDMKALEESVQNERKIRIEHQLNWNLFKEKIIRRDNDKIDSSLMTSINTNLVQGAGLGTLVSLGTMIEQEMKLQGDRYLVQKDLLDMLIENLGVTKKLITIIQETEHAISQTLEKKSTSLTEIVQLIESVVKENEKYHQINGHQIKLAENKYQKFTLDINLHKPSFAKVIKECLINALKFSEPNTNIYIFYEVTKDGFQISILNSPPKNSEYPEGLPIAYHRLIFEPFFRLSRFVFEDYETLDYGMGLCYADKIIKNHNGKMNISNLKSHLEEDQGILIKFMIELPFLA